MEHTERNASVTSAAGTRHTVNQDQLNVTSVFTKRGEHAIIDHVADADEEVLVALGYKQEFKRYLGPKPAANLALAANLSSVISLG